MRAESFESSHESSQECVDGVGRDSEVDGKCLVGGNGIIKTQRRIVSYQNNFSAWKKQSKKESLTTKEELRKSNDEEL